MEPLWSTLAAWTAAVGAFFAADPAVLTAPDMLTRIGVQVLLLLASAFFSGSETALFSLSRVHLRQLRLSRDPQAETIHKLLDQPRRLIISILCGNELINIAASINLTVILIELYGIERAVWVSIIVMVPLLLLLGEVTPKTIAVSNPARVSSRIIAPLLGVWFTVVTPLYRVVRVISDQFTTWIVGAARHPENLLKVDELRSLVERGVLEGELTATERTLIFNLLRSGATECVEIMTPRTRIHFVNAAHALPDIVAACAELKTAYVPLYEGHRDNVVGILHAEDVVGRILDEDDLASLRLEQVMRPPLKVPMTTPVDELFDLFDGADDTVAVLMGEFGNMVGMVSLNDVLDFIFGFAYHSPLQLDRLWRDDLDVHVFPGETSLIAFNAMTNLGLTDDRMTSLGGFVLRHLDRMPAVGDSVTIDGRAFKVLSLHNDTVAEVSVTDLSATTPPDDEDG